MTRTTQNVVHQSAFHQRAYQMLLAALFAALQALVPAQAQALSAKDEKAVQTVVQSQLAAFAKDDADKAFSYAAPQLRKSIGNSSAFMAMVKNSYPVVYRPASVAFLKPEGSGDDVIQRVQMLDASGASYLAVYSLQRQKDKTWRISGCALVENKGRMA
jgi:chlorite dismutase